MTVTVSSGTGTEYALARIYMEDIYCEFSLTAFGGLYWRRTRGAEPWSARPRGLST